MPEIKVKNYLYQILKGLEHLHMNGLFHRDIKPENILMKVLEDNHVKDETRIILIRLKICKVL